MPPGFEKSAYRALTFTLNRNECKQVPIRGLDNNHKIDFGVCYYKNFLYLDPSRYEVKQRLGTVQIPMSPLWNRGFTYNKIKSSGYARLANADITIKYLGNNDNTPVSDR